MIFRKLNLTALTLFMVHPIAMAIEEPDYVVVDTSAEFELRRYAPYLVAEVDVSGDFDEAGNSAFRTLASYIFGDNDSGSKMKMTAPVEARLPESGERMAMTAPVTSTTGGVDNLTTFAFVMERRYTLETLPVPNNPIIRIREMPERTMAVRRYSGRWTQARYRQNLDVLKLALSKAGIKTIGDPVLARYNSPFSLPMLRRNEVMLEIEKQETLSRQPASAPGFSNRLPNPGASATR